MAQGVALAQAPIVPIDQRPIPEIVTYYANEYDVPITTLLRVMKCESGGIQSKIGDRGLAHGIFQFHPDTWSDFTGYMGEKLDRENPQHQARVAAWAFSHHYEKRWTCK